MLLTTVARSLTSRGPSRIPKSFSINAGCRCARGGIRYGVTYHCCVLLTSLGGCPFSYAPQRPRVTINRVLQTTHGRRLEVRLVGFGPPRRSCGHL